jgi:hypothetical protein
MSTQSRAVVWAAACSFAVVGVGLFLPVWKEVKFGNRESVWINDVPVWVGLTDYLRGPPRRPDWTQHRNRFICLALLVIAGGIGALVYRYCRPRTRPVAADDYSDGPGGSVVDGSN